MSKMTTFKYICNRQGASLLYQQQDQKLTFIRARCNNGELQVFGGITTSILQAQK